MSYLHTQSHGKSASYWGKPSAEYFHLSPWEREKLSRLPIRTRGLATCLLFLCRDGGNGIALGSLPTPQKQRALITLERAGIVDLSSLPTIWMRPKDLWK
jgi:hypothetical protein